MKNQFKNLALLFTGIAFLAFAFNAFSSDDAVTTDATVTILEPIEITKDEDLDFGILIIEGNGIGTAVLDPEDGSVSGTGDISTSSGRTPTAAEYSVTGTEGENFTIELPDDATLELVGGADELVLDNFSISGAEALSGTTSSGNELGSSAFEFSVGATANFDGDQSEGTYEGEFDVTVAYE